MRRLLLSIAGLAAAGLVMTSTPPARASSDGEAYAIVIGVAIFDVVSLPADIYMAATGTKVPRDYAWAEAIGGGAQALAGGIGLTYCAMDRECKRDAGFPLLIGFTAWTTVMSLHGIYSLTAHDRSTASLPPKASPFNVVPMIGDGRTTPAGIGITGTF